MGCNGSHGVGGSSSTQNTALFGNNGGRQQPLRTAGADQTPPALAQFRKDMGFGNDPDGCGKA